MHIVMITGSPHRHGASALLAEEFLRGAQEAGHTVFRFDTASECVHPALAASAAHVEKTPASFRTQCANCIGNCQGRTWWFSSRRFITTPCRRRSKWPSTASRDRQCARGSGKKAMLLMTAADREEHIFRGAAGSYHEMVWYLGWQDCGMLLCGGCYTREDIEKTGYPQKAYALGRALQ